jgi:PKD repeat protein
MSAFSATWCRSLLAGLVSLLLWAGVAVAPSAARADTVPLDPADPATPATVSADPLPTVQINGVAWAQVVVGNTVYVAGSFTRARPAGAAPGTQETVRNNLLAYDIRTGALVTSFAPNLNSQAMALAASPDGSRLYVGGQFTYANGQPRNRVAAYDTSTGQLVSTFRPAVNSTVRALAATATTVYLGGDFSAVGSTARARMAAVSAANGALQTWAPQPGTGSTAGNRLPNDPEGNARTSSSVLAMVVAGRNQVVVGGRFDSLNGTKATGVGAVDATTGATRPFAVNSLITNQGINSAIHSLSTDGTTVYGTGYDYYGPGNLEGSFAAAADGGALRWINECHGDTYSAFPVNGALYHATHAHVCSNIGSFPEQSPQLNMYATAVSLAVTGTTGTATLRNKNLAGQPAPSVLPWFPTFYAGAYTKQYQAGWSVTGNQDYVVYGGEFPAVNGTEQQGLVRFAVRPLAPNKVGPRATGTFAPTATLLPGAVRLSWKAVHDRDNEHLTYRVYRGSVNTAPVCEVTRPSQWWNLPTYGCADTTAPAGTHGWVVVASDPTGNRLNSSWVTATVGAANSSPARTYGQMVVRDGATGHWPLGETSGTTAHDRAGVQDMAAGTGVGRGRTGAVAGDADTAYEFDGTAAGSLSTQTATAAPQVFTVEAWFRTQSTRGGKIVGFGNARTGLSTAYDRHVYLDAQGRVSFGVYSGGTKAITTSGAYNDGDWHHVAGSLSPAGLSLYVDGELVGTRADVVRANPITGYWRVGGDKSWATGLDWFAGQVDEVAVYPTALRAEQVAAHTVAGTTGQAPNVAPTAAFTATTPDHLTAAFDASASADTDGRVTAHAWDFGDGTTGEGATVTHTYAAAGTYTVRLTVTDDRAGTATTTRPVTVTAPPVGPGSIARDTFGRELASGWGSAETGGAWTPAGTAADMAVTAGSGRLTAAPGTTAGGTLAVSARDVAVQADVVLERAASGGGSWVSLGSRLVGGTLYSAQLFFAADGTVQLSLVRSVSWTETWLAGTTLPGRYTPGTSLTVRFEVEGTAPAALRVKAWTTGTAQPEAWQVQTTDATAALQRPGGLRTAVYTARSATAATAVRVDGLRAEPAGTVAPQPEPVPNAAPTAAFTATPAGLTVTFDGAGSADADGRVTAHAWEFGDGSTGTGATASRTYAAAGTYQVRLTVTDDDGATATVTRAVTVTAPAPQPAPDALAADAFEREVAGALGPADVGGTWTGYGGAANLQVTGGAGVLTAAPAASTGGELAIAARDLTVQADVVLDRAPTGGGSYVSLNTRSVGGTLYKTSLWFAADGRVQLNLVRVVSWTDTVLSSTTLPGRYTPGTALTVRVEVAGSGSTTLRAKAWAAGTAEPTAWQVQGTDTTASLQRAGALRLDLYTSRSSTGSATIRVDDLWAGAPGQTPPAR